MAKAREREYGNYTAAELRRLLPEWAASPVAYRRDLWMKTGRGPRRFGEVIADFQRKDFEAIDAAFLAVARGRKPEPGRLWIERTKGASKDSDLASALLWLLAFTPRTICGKIGASDQDQADELRKAAKDFVALNPWLTGQGIEIQSTAILGRLGSRIDIIASDEEGSHGGRPDLLILNEITRHSDRGFADTMFGEAAKVPHCVTIVATNAGEAGSWQERLRNRAMVSPRWYFSAYQEPAPWLDPEDIADLDAHAPVNWFLRNFKGQWVGKSCAALTDEDVKAAMITGTPPAAPVRGFAYFGGLDLGHTRDAAGFVVLSKSVGWLESKPIERPPPSLAVRAARAMGEIPDYDLEPQAEQIWHPGDGRLAVVAAIAWTPQPGRPVSLDAVEEGVAAVHSRLPLAWLYGDPWNFAQMLERLRKKGVTGDKCDFTPANLQAMAKATLEAFRDRVIDLPDQAPGISTLAADVAAIRAVEKSYGFRLEAPKKAAEGGTRHGDIGTALQLAILAATRHAYSGAAGSGPPRLNRPLLTYP